MQVYCYDNARQEPEELGFIPAIIGAAVGIASIVAGGVAGKKSRDAAALQTEMALAEQRHTTTITAYNQKKQREMITGLSILTGIGVAGYFALKEPKKKRRGK